MGTELDRLTEGKYVLVTTYRRSGTPVPTPVWVVRDGDRVAFWSAADAGKIKRLRHTADVELAPCDFRGKPTGSPVPGKATILDRVGSDRVRDLLARKYGLIGRVTLLGSRLRRGSDGTVCVSVELAR